MKMIFTIGRRPEGYMVYHISPSGQTMGEEMYCTDPTVAIDKFKLLHPRAQYVDDVTFGKLQEKIEADKRKIAEWNRMVQQ